MRIDDVSPTVDTMTRSLGRTEQSVSGKGLCVAVSADGSRAYLGGHSGVWRSDDGGESWWHPEWRPAAVGGPTPPGALPVPNVYDLLISPADDDVVLAATGRDARLPGESGVNRSTDGGLSWTRVHRFLGTTARAGLVGRLAAVPGEPATVYAAGELAVAWSDDGGLSWTERPVPGRTVSHVVAGPRRPAGRRVVVAGGQGISYSVDGGLSWSNDPVGLRLGAVTDGLGASCRALTMHPLDPDVVYLAQGDLTFWRGRYPPLPSTGPAAWTQLPSPPVAGGTDSGGTFLIAHATPEGRVVLFASDRRSVHGAAADPATVGDWFRAEDGNCHVDPHGLALTPDFRDRAAGSPPTFGRAVLVNDGGINVSTDGMRTWRNARGLSTLNAANVAVNAVAGKPASICMGGGDNFGFSSPDGGATWRTQDYLGGDNDCCFADPRQPSRMLVFAPRSVPANGVKGEIYLYLADGGSPDTALGASKRRIPAPPPVLNKPAPAGGKPVAGWNVVSHYFNFGYRPLVLTRSGEKPRPDGDFVTIRFTGVVGVNPAVLVRTTAITTITADTDWVTGATAEGPGVKSFQVGPPLPDPLVSVVQGSGGHDAPTFYVGDGATTVTGARGPFRLWKLPPGGTAWQQLVPAAAAPGRPAPRLARRFFVDPFRPKLVYVLGSDGVYRTDDGGATWVVDDSLQRALTEDGAYPVDVPADLPNAANQSEAILRDMQFDARRPGFRVAAGVAGVVATFDGRTWRPLARSSALAVWPTSLFYDPVSCDRAVYVSTSNRGLLRLSPLPPDWEFPVGSLRATQGRITLLRVHDVGTGFGPPEDVLDAEVVVLLDTEPEKAFGFRLRRDAEGPAAAAKLALLRDCFNGNRPVRLEFLRTGCRSGTIRRVIEGS